MTSVKTKLTDENDIKICRPMNIESVDRFYDFV